MTWISIVRFDATSANNRLKELCRYSKRGSCGSGLEVNIQDIHISSSVFVGNEIVLLFAWKLKSNGKYTWNIRVKCKRS